MKNRFLLFLKKNPKLYNFVEAIYNVFQRIIFKFKGTKGDENYWENRHLNSSENKKDDWGNENTDWIQGYWDSVNHAHRNFLIERISQHHPSSILEIGCNCGPNLHLLAKKFPQAQISGIDINPLAVKNGNDWFAREGIKNVQLFACKADDLSQFADKSFDIVFTDAVLIYFGPDKIKQVVSEMLRVSKKAILLLEWNDFEQKNNTGGKLLKHWIRNYENLFKEMVNNKEIQIEKMNEGLWADKNWQKYGALVEIIESKEN